MPKEGWMPEGFLYVRFCYRKNIDFMKMYLEKNEDWVISILGQYQLVLYIWLLNVQIYNIHKTPVAYILKYILTLVDT